MTSRSRGAVRPRFASQCPALEKRGRREDRVLAAPAVSRAKCANKNAHEHTGSAEAVRPSLRDGFTAYIVLSPARPGFVVTVASVMRSIIANLTPATGASGPHDFAVRLTRCSSKAHPRPPLPAPTSVTMANAPLSRDGMAKNKQVIWIESEAKYFCKKGWTQHRVICPIGRQTS